MIGEISGDMERSRKLFEKDLLGVYLLPRIFGGHGNSAFSKMDGGGD